MDAAKVAKEFLQKSTCLHGSGRYCSCEGCCKKLAEVIGNVVKPIEDQLVHSQDELDKAIQKIAELEHDNLNLLNNNLELNDKIKAFEWRMRR